MTLIGLYACGTTKGQQDTPSAAALSEEQAARETEISGLRLVEPPAVATRLSALGVHLGYVENDVAPGGGRYRCGGIPRHDAQAAAGVINQALAHLPDESVKRIRLRYVILCRGTTADGRPIGGIPVPPLQLLMVDIGSAQRSYLDHLFLHELYHLIEFQFNTFADADWDREFGGYDNSYANVQTPAGNARAGFVDGYAQSFPHEDRAELFASLVLYPERVRAQADARNDDMLRAKTGYMVDKTERLIGLRLTN
jgi:hypothetical protein